MAAPRLLGVMGARLLGKVAAGTAAVLVGGTTLAFASDDKSFQRMFDPEALERGAAALKEINKSPFAKNVSTRDVQISRSGYLPAKRRFAPPRSSKMASAICGSHRTARRALSLPRAAPLGPRSRIADRANHQRAAATRSERGALRSSSSVARPHALARSRSAWPPPSHHLMMRELSHAPLAGAGAEPPAGAHQAGRGQEEGGGGQGAGPAPAHRERGHRFGRPSAPPAAAG